MASPHQRRHGSEECPEPCGEARAAKRWKQELLVGQALPRREVLQGRPAGCSGACKVCKEEGFRRGGTPLQRYLQAPTRDSASG